MTQVTADNAASVDATAGPDLGDQAAADAAVEQQPHDSSRGAVWRILDLVVVAGCALFVFWQLHPNLILAPTTPAGGDMGAHVWALAYLRDELLPNLRFSGWTPDWYAGFPAFQFYMVVPFLAMVVLNTGVAGVATLVPALASIALAARAGGASLRDRAVLTALGLLGVAGLVLGVWHTWNPSYRFVLIAAGVTAGAVALTYGRGTHRRSLATASIVLAPLAIALPYGTSFKLIAVLGVSAIPVTAYLFGRLAGFPTPTPVLLAIGSLWFLFDKNFTIYGGNVASTMAGEFAFSISLALALAYLGVVVRGLRTGRHRGLAAVLLALVGLCHLIPAFFALGMTAILLVGHVLDERGRLGDEGRRVAGVLIGAVLVVLGGGLAALMLDLATTGPVIAVTTSLVAIVALLAIGRTGPARADASRPGASGGEVAGGSDADTAETPLTDAPELDPAPDPIGRARLWWVASMGAVAALLAAWWVLPFFSSRTYLNDMGWEKTAVHRDGVAIWDWFTDEVWSVLVTDDIRVFAALALVGAVLSVAFRNRVGVAMVVAAIGLALAFVYTPQGRLWNARLLPFWYLVIYLLAAVGVGEVVRALGQLFARDPRRPGRGVAVASVLAVLLSTVAFLGGQLRNFPGGATNADGTYRLVDSVGLPGLFSVDVPDAVAIDIDGRNFATDWARWNFTGYEGRCSGETWCKARYPEYYGIVTTMAEVGATHGCGRALWEYSPDLNDYGTPMALMLLPHWTEGCIGSMEGLYFEASSTTPFHFLMQSELSASPSRAQRDMPYRDLDVDAGVDHLQLLGVRYYMARSAEANIAAADHPDLTEIAADGPWVVYEVADSELVEPLAHEPAVTTGGEKQDEWLCSGTDESGRCTGTALDWFQDPTQWDVPITATGPSEWQRLEHGEIPEERALPPVKVSDVEIGNDTISFSVDRPGVPVYVKVSYFPNWSVSGGDGPYRAAPNLMVVVPSSDEVTLHFDRSTIDLVAIGLTLLGIAALVVLVRRPPVRVRRLADPV